MTKKIITLLVTFFIFLTNVTLVSATSKELTEYPGQSQAVDIIIEAISTNFAKQKTTKNSRKPFHFFVKRFSYT